MQWHSDGLEFEVNSVYPGAMCQGVFQQGFYGKVKDFHVVFTYDSNGKVNGHIEEEIIVVVSPGGDEYHGVANQKIVRPEREANRPRQPRRSSEADSLTLKMTVLEPGGSHSGFQLFRLDALND